MRDDVGREGETEKDDKDEDDGDGEEAAAAEGKEDTASGANVREGEGGSEVMGVVRSTAVLLFHGSLSAMSTQAAEWVKSGD